VIGLVLYLVALAALRNAGRQEAPTAPDIDDGDLAAVEPVERLDPVTV
jgi:hypothetical protein